MVGLVVLVVSQRMVSAIFLLHIWLRDGEYLKGFSTFLTFNYLSWERGQDEQLGDGGGESEYIVCADDRDDLYNGVSRAETTNGQCLSPYKGWGEAKGN